MKWLSVALVVWALLFATIVPLGAADFLPAALAGAGIGALAGSRG